MQTAGLRYVTVPARYVTFQGYLPATAAPATIWKNHHQAEDAAAAEASIELKQIVAYGFIEQGGKILRVKRTGKSNRAELLSKLSIGVGGHMEEKDMVGQATLEGALQHCLQRELAEELIFTGEPSLKLLGYINDESIPTGKRHMAAFHRVSMCQGELRVRRAVQDQEFGEGSWAMVTLDEVARDYDQYDPWSQIIIKQVLLEP